MIKNDYEQQKENWGENFILHYLCHSRGAADFYAATKEMDEEIRKKINVTTFGAAKFAPTDLYKKAVNIVNDRDIVPKFAQIFSVGQNVDVRYTGYSSGTPWSCLTDHLMACPGYDKALYDTCLEIIK